MLQLQIDDTNRFCYSDAHSNKQMRNGLPDYLVTGFLEARMMDNSAMNNRHRGCGLRRPGGEGLWATIRFAVAAATAVIGWTRPQGKWQLWQNGKEPFLFFLSKKGASHVSWTGVRPLNLRELDLRFHKKNIRGFSSAISSAAVCCRFTCFVVSVLLPFQLV
jgi:hypothetical protein